MNNALRIIAVLCILSLISCQKKDKKNGPNLTQETEYISAVDISSYPEITAVNPIFFDSNKKQLDFLKILKDNGVNTLRLRLWVQPNGRHCGFEEVRQFSKTLKNYGFKVWLTLHYSDTWADPGHQVVPKQWQGRSFAAVGDSVYAYTEKAIREIDPNFIQIGNEINSGFLHPYGTISGNNQDFIALLQRASTAIRKNSNHCKIILHYAGIDGAAWFYNAVASVDYDIIGLSYYPIWHGKSLQALKATFQDLRTAHNKAVVVAETAYPFTLDWNDWTNNIVGLDAQLILPDYPATGLGQKAFVQQVKKTVLEIDGGLGFCYWGGELIAWKGDQSTQGSVWENQALFDFENVALPVLSVFRMP